jgi:phosphohistidine phosphatase
MKTLIVVRHAKSSWAKPGLEDFDRPLNDRGKEDAPKMAKILAEKKLDIDALVSSPAKRAYKTASIFRKELDIKKTELIEAPALYEASLKTFFRIVENLKDDWNAVAIFSHNPGITDFINALETHPIYNMPTCSVYAIQIRIDSWKDFEAGKKKFLFFDYPKGIDQAT